MILHKVCDKTIVNCKLWGELVEKNTGVLYSYKKASRSYIFSSVIFPCDWNCVIWNDVQ
jgi:hypothetical protein